MAASKPSSQMAHLLDKKGKQFSNAELIKLCLITAAEDLVQKKTFKILIFWQEHVRVEDRGSNTDSQLRQHR